MVKMPVLKDDHNDSDGDEVDPGTPDSEKSSNDALLDSSSASGSDDDDSSEMDEEDCERRRSECMEDMADLEQQFFHLKHQLYRERSAQLEIKLEEVRAGRAPEYLQPLEELQENMRTRTEVAGILRELKLENIKVKHKAESLAILQNFESEKALLCDSIRSELEDKIRRLEEDRNSVDITSDLWTEQVNHRKKRKSDIAPTEKRKKAVTVSGPYIVYMLHENEILEDWTTIRKALKAAKQKSEYEFPNHEQKYIARFADGKLVYEGSYFSKGDRVIIENQTESPLLANIVSMNTSEIVIRKRDGNRMKLGICEFQSGKYFIRHSPV